MMRGYLSGIRICLIGIAHELKEKKGIKKSDSSQMQTVRGTKRIPSAFFLGSLRAGSLRSALCDGFHIVVINQLSLVGSQLLVVGTYSLKSYFEQLYFNVSLPHSGVCGKSPQSRSLSNLTSHV